ncbi:hypothetical protein DPMN_015220 [Dreissena polymorpha]|uniref:Uncharacterized protein n=1 Tax=Dreissena polymorpha TaxID=45954 RepID=A0A9D4NB66_DREPO|nr:hypothetical protein DPMN_015220 [Dreissena polymorpha]
MAAKGQALVVAAIDFGTTYSGWAFSFKHDYDRDPTKVSAKTWTGGQLTSLKGPTCILIKPDGKTLEAFAYDAETRYSELSENNEHKQWYYFRRFKMELWKKSIHKDTVLEDECGRELLALTVFSLSIRFMKDDLCKISESQVAGLKADDIHWVLTVPAIWNDSAKQFMRLAAEQAGISSDKLTLALEPEAASLYCRYLPVQKDGESSLSTLKAGKKYLVLDAGGGTIDITVHEVCTGDNLKELHKASGGDWGGTKVDAAFIEFLGKITDKKAMQKFKDVNMEDYIELLRDFEIKKRAIDTSKPGKITIKVPISLIDHVKDVTGKTLKDKLQSLGYGNKVTLAGDKIRLDPDIMRSFFSTSLTQIVEHVSDLLRKVECSGVEAILMVGGYSECMLLKEAIKQRFSQLKIIVPPDAGLAVLKGAVIYGHSPMTITERVSKYTYGTDISSTFIAGEHPWSKFQILKDGSIRCSDIFSKLVEVGDKLVVGQAQNEESYTPVFDDQKALGVTIFATSDKNPKFTTDVGCQKIGAISVPLAGSGKERSVKVRIIFGGTEITVECQETATGKITRLPINFLI